MLNNMATRSKVLLGFFFAILLTGLGFYGCGTNSSSTLDLGPTAAAPIPVSVSADPLIPVPVVPPSTAITGIAAASAGQVTISAPNTLANGDIVAISGSTNYNGTYTAINPTPPSFTIAAPFVGPLVPSGTTPPVFQPQILATPVTGIAPSTTTGQVTIVANNTLTNGTPIVITGSSIDALNGPNTVIAPTPATFSITTTYVPPPVPPAGTSPTPLPAGTTLGVVLAGGGVLPNCTTTTTGSATAITLPSVTTVPSRFTGVAPLAVFFDATGTTATATTRPFHDLEYQWGFGDVAGSPVSGTTWGNGSRPGISSRNTATGPVAAHVFETPGTYIVNLSVVDGKNTVSNSCVQIAVQNPNVVFAGTNTICFSTSGTFTGCPSGATQVTTSNFVTALSIYQATGKRLLFRRGETFTAASAAAITASGPGIVGAYDSGAFPKIQNASNTAILTLSSKTTPNMNDWRIMDLELDGSLSATPNRVYGVQAQGGANQITLLRLNIHDVYGHIAFGDDILNVWNSGGSPVKLYDQITIADSTLLHGIGGQGSVAGYIAATQLAWLGNSIDDTINIEHGLRIVYTNRGVISNSLFSRAAGTDSGYGGKTVLTIRAPDFGGSSTIPAGNYTEKVVISDNKFVPHSTQNGTVGQGPLGTAYDGRLRDLIWERNWWTPPADGPSSVQVDFALTGSDTTIRNNIVAKSGNTTDNRVFSLEMTNTSPGYPLLNNVSFYNNTVYSSDTGRNFDMVLILSKTGTPTNVTAKNNLAYAPGDLGPSMLIGSFAASSNNSTDSPAGGQLKNTSLNLATTPPVSPADYKPVTGSYAIGTGASVPVWSDFFGNVRTASYDMGAVNH